MILVLVCEVNCFGWKPHTGEANCPFGQIHFVVKKLITCKLWTISDLVYTSSHSNCHSKLGSEADLHLPVVSHESYTALKE